MITTIHRKVTITNELIRLSFVTIGTNTLLDRIQRIKRVRRRLETRAPIIIAGRKGESDRKRPIVMKRRNHPSAAIMTKRRRKIRNAVRRSG